MMLLAAVFLGAGALTAAALVFQPVTADEAWSLQVARRLSGLWPLLYVLIVIPRPLRDWLYDRFAARRYRWFGKREACMVPTPELRERFLA